MVVALVGVTAATGATHHKHHKACYSGKGTHRHKVKCHPKKPKRGCRALPPTGSTPGAAHGRVVLETGGGDGGTVRLLGKTFRQPTRFICWERTRVTIKAVPDPGWRFAGWTASDDRDPSFMCPNGSTSCTVKLINHGRADNLGPKPPDDYSVYPDFCQPSGRVSCP
jgi:hypothetical protein